MAAASPMVVSYCLLNMNLMRSFYLAGLVEIVTESDTLRKIQVKHGHGVTGSFKDKPISDWLQQQNPTELDYEKV